MSTISRRELIAKSAVTLAASALPLGAGASVTPPIKNTLPKWKGFNFLDFFNPNPAYARTPTAPQLFEWMRDWGFDFVRVPMAYPAYLNIDYNKAISAEQSYLIDESKVDKIDALVAAAHQFGLHVSLNLHRAPGYCINAGFQEPFNLWKDQAALDAFCFHWEFWAKRYKSHSRDKISFDLVNEPSWRDDMNDQFGRRDSLPAATYHRVAKAAVETIRRIKPEALIIADGNNGGHVAVPELADLNIGQSCRGYMPFNISHHKAPWVHKNPEQLPTPRWPDGPEANRQFLQEFYRPWFDLINAGVGVHCGESGAYIETPHAVFLAWFGDVIEVLAERGVGFALWEMRGDFGILNSNRKDVDYEDWQGYKLDRKLLTLLQKI